MSLPGFVQPDYALIHRRNLTKTTHPLRTVQGDSLIAPPAKSPMSVMDSVAKCGNQETRVPSSARAIGQGFAVQT
jgi:hypothetical protein